MNKIITESFIVGIVTALIGSIVIKIIINLNNDNDNEISFRDMIKKWNKYFMMEIGLFFTGILIHLFFEYVGFNKWYCEKKCYGDICTITCVKK